MDNLILIIGDNCSIQTARDSGCFADTSEFTVASRKKIPTFLKKRKQSRKTFLKKRKTHEYLYY